MRLVEVASCAVICAVVAPSQVMGISLVQNHTRLNSKRAYAQAPTPAPDDIASTVKDVGQRAADPDRPTNGGLFSTIYQWFRGKEELAPSPEELSCIVQKYVNLSMVKSLSAPVGAPLPKISGTCAVVGSSGVLIQHNYSHEIDASDFVIRFNDAPVEGYESHVGTRDDLRFINNQLAGMVLKEKTTDGFHLSNKTRYAMVWNEDDKKQSRDLDKVATENPGLEVYVGDSQLLDDISEVFQTIYDPKWWGDMPGRSLKPSTGTVGMLLALSICTEVKAFGMAWSANALTSPHYYYSDPSTDGEKDAGKDGYHRTFGAEKDLWARLASTPVSEINRTDVALIKGFSQAHCDFAVLASGYSKVPIQDSDAMDTREFSRGGTQRLAFLSAWLALMAYACA